MGDEILIQELLAEKESLDSSFVHCLRLLNQEISKVQSLTEENPAVKTEISASDYNGNLQSPISKKPKVEHDGDNSQGPPRHARPRSFRRPGELISEEVMKLTEKVMIPVKEYPKFNFVGKILGPRGNTLKRLQAQTGTKMSILGKGSMRDKDKEEELRSSGDPKYEHLQDPLHVLIEVEAPQTEAHMRLATAIAELKKYMRPENDEIRQQQMQEMAYIQSLEDPGKVPVPPLPPMPVHQLPVRSRGRAVIRAPAGLGRGGGVRGGKVRGVPAPGGLRPAGAVVASRHVAPAGDPYRKAFMKGGRREEAEAEYELGGAAYESYDTVYDTTYETSYPDTSEVYYDYGGGAEEYEYAPASSAGTITSYKAAPVRSVKRAIREAAYPY